MIADDSTEDANQPIVEKVPSDHIKKYYTKFINAAQKNGGMCLDDISAYENAHSKLRVKCRDGHEWKISMNNLNNGKWCPLCKTNIGEWISLKACEHLFQDTFIKVRPDWLLNEAGNRLELDMFCELLKLAVEYNGIQHYKYLRHFHRTPEAYAQRLNDDKIKADLCLQRGIKLIIVPYTVKNENICKYIEDEAVKLKFNIKESSDKFDYKNIRANKGLLIDVQQIVTTKRGTIITGEYISRDSPLTIKCELDHTWSTLVKYIIRGIWCPVCGTKVMEETKEKLSIKLKSFNASEEGKKTKLISSAKRSETLLAAKMELRNNIIEKKCNRCKLTKPVRQFNKKSAAKDGLQTNCAQCVQILKQEYALKKTVK